MHVFGRVWKASSVHKAETRMPGFSDLQKIPDRNLEKNSLNAIFYIKHKLALQFVTKTDQKLSNHATAHRLIQTNQAAPRLPAGLFFSRLIYCIITGKGLGKQKCKLP